jgi:hypothetical protein
MKKLNYFYARFCSWTSTFVLALKNFPFWNGGDVAAFDGGAVTKLTSTHCKRSLSFKDTVEGPMIQKKVQRYHRGPKDTYVEGPKIQYREGPKIL